ncbi:MAG TPA: hypothetical protein PLZ51_17955 [Aggregatilineales bacterium]|nr:hypothetical protein [Aggregatilineales bacterium]
MLGSFLSSVLAALCFAVYIPIFFLGMRHLTTGEVKVRRPVDGGVEIKRLTGYRATIYAMGQLLTWFPAAYSTLMVIQTNNIGYLFLGVVFSVAVGYANGLLAQRMEGEITPITFKEMGFKFNFQNFAKNNFNVQMGGIDADADEPEKPKRGMENADIEDAVFYDVPPEEKRKNDEDVDL